MCPARRGRNYSHFLHYFALGKWRFVDFSLLSEPVKKRQAEKRKENSSFDCDCEWFNSCTLERQEHHRIRFNSLVSVLVVTFKWSFQRVINGGLAKLVTSKIKTVGWWNRLNSIINMQQNKVQIAHHAYGLTTEDGCVWKYIYFLFECYPTWYS